MSLMVSISGIRGIVGESLSPETVVRYASAFGGYCKDRTGAAGEVVLGRDGRSSGRTIADLIASALASAGVRVRDLGICPTPTVQLAVEGTKAAGGISVTASHNPIQWNGMKFVAPTGMFLDAEENRAFWAIAERTPGYVSWEGLGSRTHDSSWIKKHIDAVMGIPLLDLSRIRQRRLKVVVDCVNAAGGVIVPTLLNELGCDVVEMNCDVSGVFPHLPEPVPENLTELAAQVRASRADFGVAVDPDVDRLVLITERGEPFGEEYTVASAVKFVLDRVSRAAKGKTPLPDRVVVNLSTTRAVEEIAASYGASVFRTPVGEINVAKKMKEVDAIIGGEGSGGVIYPAVHLGRDAMVGIGLILQLIAEFEGTVSQLKASLPQFSIVKGKIDIGQKQAEIILGKVMESHAGTGKVNLEDGLKIDFPDHWVHLRKSNTEPIIRIIAEARTRAEALAVVEKYRGIVAALGT